MADPSALSTLTEVLSLVQSAMALESNQDLLQSLKVYQIALKLLSELTVSVKGTELESVVTEHQESVKKRSQQVLKGCLTDSDLPSVLSVLSESSISLGSDDSDLQRLQELHRSMEAKQREISDLEARLSETRAMFASGADSDLSQDESESEDVFLAALRAKLDRKRSQSRFAAEVMRLSQETEASEEPSDEPISEECPLLSQFSEALISHIWSFLSARESVVAAFEVSKEWRKAFLSNHSLIRLVFSRIVIGADPSPIRSGFGHNSSLTWLKGSPLNPFVKDLVICTGIATGVKHLSSEECAVLHCPSLSSHLSSVILYSSKITRFGPLTVLGKLVNLRHLFVEEHLSLVETSKALPRLEALSASSVDCDVSGSADECFPSLRFVSFIFGVNSRNIAQLFSALPNIEYLALEFDDLCYDFSFLVDSRPSLRTIHFSLNLKSFWTLPGGIGATVCEKHIRRWLFGCEVGKIILDRDYQVAGLTYEDVHTRPSLASILEEILAKEVEIQVCDGECSFGLSVFSDFCSLF